jgi:hypothetical protein
VKSIDAEGLHFSRSAQTGNTFAASSGAKLRDLMVRMGHDSECAALIYQHESHGADQAITDAINRHVQADIEGGDGETGAPAPVSEWHGDLPRPSSSSCQ